MTKSAILHLMVMPMSERVKDKVAMVMGAGSVGPGWGNGKAAAVLYAREGARVLAVDLVQSAGEETQRIIQSEGGRCRALQADVSCANSVNAVVDECLRDFGRVDILHNNVGIPRPAAPKTLPKTTGIDSLQSTSGVCT